MRFKGTAVIGGVTVQKVVTTTGGTSPSTSESYLNVTDLGVYSYSTSSASVMTMLKFPIIVGNKFIMDPDNANQGTNEVVACETVTVSAGTFKNCFLIVRPATVSIASSYAFWYAPNVGLVKEVIVSIPGGGSPTSITTLELSSTGEVSGGGVEYYPHGDKYSRIYNWTNAATTETAQLALTFYSSKDCSGIEAQILRYNFLTSFGSYLALQEYYKVSDDAVYWYGSNGTVYSPALSLSFPLVTGKTWVFTSGSTNITSEVVTYESCAVPLGTFSNCAKIKSYNPSSSTTNESWYAENIGLVKEISITNGTPVTTMELKSTYEAVGMEDYYPHNDTYSWKYNATMTSTTDTVPITMCFNGTTVIDPKTGPSVTVQNLITTTGSTSPSTSESYVRVTDSGAFSYVTSPSRVIAMLTFPTFVGDKYTIDPSNANQGTNEVVAFGSVTVPAGTYNNCYVIARPSTALIASSYTFWFAPNVGLVKEVIESTNGGSTTVTTLELTSKSF